MSSNRSHWLISILVFAILTAICILPPPSKLSREMAPNAGDGVFVTWTMEREIRSLNHPAQIFDGKIEYPHANTIAWSDNLLIFTPVYGILWEVTGHNSALSYNVIAFLGFLAVCIATYALMERLFDDWRASLIASLLFDFSLIRTSSIAHFQLNGFLFVILGLLYLMKFLDHRRRKDAILLGCCATGTWLSSTYYFVLLLLAFVAFGLVWILKQRARPGRPFLAPLLVGGVVAAITLAPFVIPYIHVRNDVHILRADRDLTVGTAKGLTNLPDSALYRALGKGTTGDSNRLFPGIVASAFAVFGIALSIKQARKPHEQTTVFERFIWPLVAAAAVGVFLTIGVHHGVFSLPFRLMRKAVPGLNSIREVTRFWVMPMLVWAIFAGLGVAWLLKRFRGQLSNVIFVALVLLIAGELVVRPSFSPIDFSSSTRTVNTTLRKLPEGVVTELPQTTYPQYSFVAVARQLRAIDDDKPRLLGYSGFDPPEFFNHQALTNAVPDPRAVAELQALKVKYIILHGGATGATCQDRYNEADLNAISSKLAAMGAVITNVGKDAIVTLPSQQLPRATPYTPPPVQTLPQCPRGEAE